MKATKLTNRQKSKLIGLLVLIGILFFSYLSTEAQINQRFKGYRIEADTAIVMSVPTYRNIRDKIMLADNAILHLENRVLSQNQLIDLLQRETRNLISQTQLQNDFIQSSKLDLAEIKRSVAELKDMPDPKLPFYKQDWFLILGGAILTIAIIK